MRAHVKNNIGFLRLVFASLVIVGHAPQMTDGNLTREPVAWLFHTTSMTLGHLSVLAFFMMSGMVITESMKRTNALLPYLSRRVLRIYPAFVIASLLTIFVMGLAVGADVGSAWRGTIVRIALLRQPMHYSGQLPGMVHSPFLNGAMWTIGYEFACYLLTLLLWKLKLLQAKAVILLAGLFLAVTFVLPYLPPTRIGALDAYDPNGAMFSFGAAFLTGGIASLCRLRATGLVAIIGITLALATLPFNFRSEDALFIVFASPALLWTVNTAYLRTTRTINTSWDISYGTYLYGWPIATYLRWIDPTISPWLLAGVTLPLAWTLGAASWWGLERWCKISKTPHQAPSGCEAPTFMPT